MKIGFLGLGIMGVHMANHLIDAGHDISTAIHRSPAHETLLAKGLDVLASPKAVAEAAETVITMVSDTPDVEDVLFRPDGVAAGLTTGMTLIDMSSISPLDTKAFAARIAELGCDYLDAPVSGGDIGARDGTLTIMVGGPEAAFARALPLLEVMGKTITHIGGNGDGQTAKVANQIIVALTVQAVSEALVFASKAGADVNAVRQALMGGFAGSRVLDIHGKRMIERSFEPGFRISLHQKDLNIALSGARELGVALPGTACAQQLLSGCVAQGGADWDTSAMIRTLEALADHAIG